MDRLEKIKVNQKMDGIIANKNDARWLIRLVEHYRDELAVAAKYFEEGKRRMNLTTTNSHVDYFISKYSK